MEAPVCLHRRRLLQKQTAANMAIPWGLVSFIAGLLYGWLAAGKQDKSELFKKGLLIGIVLAIVLAVLGWLTDAPALGVGGTLAIIWTAIVLALLFILGVWIGDLIEGRKRR